jgi:hypothetical protein
MPFPILTAGVVPCPIPMAVATSYPIPTAVVVAIPLLTAALPLLPLRRRFLLANGFGRDSLSSSSMVAVVASRLPSSTDGGGSGHPPTRGSRSSSHDASRGLWRGAERGCYALDGIVSPLAGRFTPLVSYLQMLTTLHFLPSSKEMLC